MTDVVMIQDRHSKRVVFQAKTEQAIKFISNGLMPKYKGEQRDINKSLAYNFYCQLVNNDFKVVVCQVVRGGQYHGTA